MQIQLLKELVRTIAGKDTEAIVDILGTEKSVNEFKIAEKLKLTINQTRNILYKLYNQNIVSFTRKKDEKKGWYIYFWVLNTLKSLEKLLNFKNKELYDLEHQVKSKENKHFYICTSDNLEFNEETAIHHDFICPECGQLLKLATFDKKIEELNIRIKKVRKEIEVVEDELSKIRVIKQKELEKDIEKKKRLQKAKRARAKKKLQKVKVKSRKKPKKRARKPKKKKARKAKKKTKKGRKR
jgi:transcription initiation factor TFIIE subunit alpha